MRLLTDEYGAMSWLKAFGWVVLVILIGIYMFMWDKVIEPTLGETLTVKVGAAAMQTGGETLEKAFDTPSPSHVASATQNIEIVRDIYTPKSFTVTNNINMEKDDNASVEYSFSVLYGNNTAKNYAVLTKFHIYEREMKRILSEVMQNRIRKMSHGFKVSTTDIENDTGINDFSKNNEFTSRDLIRKDIKSDFIESFNKTYPKFTILDTSNLPEDKVERLALMNKASFYLYDLTFSGMVIDPELIAPFEKIALKPYKIKMAEIISKINDTQGKIDTQKGKNEAVALKLEAKTISDELLGYISRDVVIKASNTPGIESIIYMPINPDLSISFSNK